MKINEERIKRILKIIFGTMLLSVVLFLCIGETVMPKENPTESGSCVLFEADWERVFADGTREAVELPGRCKAEPKEVVRLETTLQGNLDDTWLCMRASQQDMRVYVGKELRKEYTTKETRFGGRNSASAFVFFPVSGEDAGEVLAIELVSDSEYAGFLNEIYIGDKYDIVYTLTEQCFVVIVVSLYMFMLSSITVLVGWVLKLVYKIKVDITYLGLGILILSLSMIVESRLRQFFLPNASIASVVGFLLTILLPYPFMVYVSRIQKGRYERIYRTLSLFVMAEFVLMVLLHVSDIWDLADSMVISYGVVVVMVAVIAVTICIDIAKGKIREYGEIVFGLIAMIVVSVWEVYLTFVPESPQHGGVALSFGLIILLFVAGFKTAKDMLAIEKEKQMAIVASEAKAQFLANMSHEIRTPINTIIGMNEMILRENQDKAVDEYAKNVQNASDLLLGLINDILDFSKIEAGKLDVLETEYYLSKMLVDVIRGIQIKADNKKLKLDVIVDETLPSVLKGDEIRIRQILNNLLSNAVKYTQQGCITLEVSAGGIPGDFALCISVKDTGIGIKGEDLDKLFNGFQRLEEKKNRYIEGTGLGLTITKQLVDLMGGIIEVTSEYGKGSCFVVKIPQRVLDETKIGKIEEAYLRDVSMIKVVKSALYAPDARILVVDDNEMNLAVVGALLKRTGIKCDMAHSGTECLELCRKSKYDLILMDHMMPEPDGVETLHILRRDEMSVNMNTEVIVLTANAITGMAEKYIKEGFSDYLAKPIVAEELEAMIHKYLPSEMVQEKEREYTDSFVDKEAGLKYCGNNEEMYQEMVEMYYSQGQKYIPKLLEYFRNRDWKNYKIIVHALKSTSLVIGAVSFSEKAKRMEQLAKENKEEMLSMEFEDFLNEYKNILDFIKKKE